MSSWILGILNGGVSASVVDNFYNKLFVLVVTFTLVCPHNFVTCLTKALYIEIYIALVWKFFLIFFRYLCKIFGVVLSVTFNMPMIYIIYIAVVVVSYLCVYLSCWLATYAYSWINIYRRWTNNGNTRQYRNKTICVGCTERTLVVSFIILLFVVCSASVIVLQIVFSTSLYESTAKWKTVWVSKRIDYWYTFSWSICNEMAAWLGVSRAAVSKVKIA